MTFAFRWPCRVVAVIAFSVIVTSIFFAETARPQTTLDRTISIDRHGSYRSLVAQRGESFVTRKLPGATAAPARSKRRTSIVYFGQITDAHITDEMSPARVELADRTAGGLLGDAWRPQEAMSLQDLTELVKNINANRVSPVRTRNGKAKMSFVLTTGDLVDNQQLNEAKWFIKIMNGGTIDPYSGKAISETNPCPDINDAEREQINAATAQRRYSGVQNFADFSGLPSSRYYDFWDPDKSNAHGPYSHFPTYSGLMDRAQQPFKSPGVDVPWYLSRGNHDGLLKGTITQNAFLTSFVTGCTKLFPSASFDPQSLSRKDVATAGSKLLEDPQFLARLFGGLHHIAPDPDRRFISEAEYKKIAGDGRAHGFGLVDSAEEKASNDNAAYYAWSPKPNLRFISLDTVAEGGGSRGNLDDSQYRWLKRELDRNTAVSYNSSGKLIRDRDPNRLIVLYGHHSLSSMDSDVPDEKAGPCQVALQPGCDADPRSSTPLHLGTTGKESVKSLLLRYPNVIAYVNGHRHQNHLDPVLRSDKKSGFWNINTASHIEFPQQGRLIELTDNHDGTLSLFATLINNLAPVKPPTPTGSRTKVDKFSNAEVASISRELSANDPQWNGTEAMGKRKDRNAELVIRDPRLLVQ